MSEISFQTTTHVDYLQIGAHEGNTENDSIFHTDLKNKNMILIEPVPYLFQKLKANYASKCEDNNIQFLNIAVSNNNDNLTLYVPSPENDFAKFPYWASQLASTNKEHIVKHSKFSSDIINLKIDEIKVPCFTLNNLIERMNIISIDKLIIDDCSYSGEQLIDFTLNIGSVEIYQTH